jgi:hypothetical protein
MRRVAAVVLVAGILLAGEACRSADSGEASSGQHASDSAFRNLGKRDASPLSPWAEAGPAYQ